MRGPVVLNPGRVEFVTSASVVRWSNHQGALHFCVRSITVNIESIVKTETSADPQVSEVLATCNQSVYTTAGVIPKDTVTSHDSESISVFIDSGRLPGLVLWAPWVSLVRTECEPIPAEFGEPSGPWSALLKSQRA